MGNTRFNLGEVQPGEIQYIRYELRRCSVVIADLHVSHIPSARSSVIVERVAFIV